MKNYEAKTLLYFDLKDTPDSSRESYFRRIQAFLSFIDSQGIEPEKAKDEDIQRFILYLKHEKRLSAGTINNYISGVRFLFTHILEKEWHPHRVPRMRRISSFPVIPPREDIWTLFETTANVKYKAMIALMYGSGLRVSEVAQLKVQDICSRTMRVRVSKAKHNTTRYTILSDTALAVLRTYFRQELAPNGYTTEDWLFPGRQPRTHIHCKTIKNTLIKQRNRLGMDASISAHTLRHCFATHALEDGVDPVHIQQMLGHKKLQTTMGYLHMTSKSLMGVQSPLDQKRTDR